MEKPGGLRSAVEIETRLDELYAQSPENFVATRNALVRELKAEKRTDEAAAVQALKRPTVAAAAINQVVRTDRGAVDALAAAADSLRAAQAKAMSGPNAALRDAMRTFTEAVDAVAATTGPARDEIAAALRTGASDTEWWEDFGHGRVSRLPETLGSDMWSAGAEPATPTPRRSASKRSLEPANRNLKKAQERLERAEAALGVARLKVEDAERRVFEERRAVADAEREIERIKEE